MVKGIIALFFPLIPLVAVNADNALPFVKSFEIQGVSRFILPVRHHRIPESRLRSIGGADERLVQAVGFPKSKLRSSLDALIE